MADIIKEQTKELMEETETLSENENTEEIENVEDHTDETHSLSEFRFIEEPLRVIYENIKGKTNASDEKTLQMARLYYCKIKYGMSYEPRLEKLIEKVKVILKQ